MRPLRFVLTLVAFLVSFLFLVLVGPWRGSNPAEYAQDQGGLATYFNWRTPSSLFPPSAIISITDDNSTNFLARPAAFGPLLPQKSLSGQLWIGSGFGDDRLGNGAAELGCSDVPGWDDGSWSAVGGSGKKSSHEGKSAATEGKNKRSVTVEDEDEDDEEHPDEDDGTDDHLHHPLPASDGMKNNGEAARKTKKPTHADIQSLQESAEIAAKVVLLSRGGCGFLEKVKWVQRRGGIALIVGDDIRGGPLVTMYARGDTSNVTIPSLFTSHTTAQLLSSLLPSGSLSTEDATRLGLALGGKSKTTAESSKKLAHKPNFTTTTATSKATATPKPKAGSKSGKQLDTGAQSKPERPRHRGWFAALFGGGSDSADSRRPPSSGNIGWVLQEEFEDDEPIYGKTTTTSTSSSRAAVKTKGPSDGFQIGIHDWRDPDLVAAQKEQHLAGSTSTTTSSVAMPKSTKAATTSLRGGSITPGSGEYAKANHEAVDLSSSRKATEKDTKTSQQSEEEEEDEDHGWLHRLFSTDGDVENVKVEQVARPATKALEPETHVKTETQHRPQHANDAPQMHEGLFVTLSPASMSSSPFFDTLLVLVVSPLVTLTVVYALLLLRSRIRRRRWRAPKSVVERLPVRTYQTMASSAASTTSSAASQASATTPLLPTASRPINARARPRARTTSEVPHGSSLRSDDMASPSLEQIEEKRAAGLAEWRRRYGGKQRECVVCLEEYVDGVSRVMSLPCGHEFHAECM